MYEVSDLGKPGHLSLIELSRVAFRFAPRRRRFHSVLVFRGSILDLHGPLFTLRQQDYSCQRKTRGQSGLLGLDCTGLSPATICQFILAHGAY